MKPHRWYAIVLALVVCSVAASPSAQAQTLTTLYTFCSQAGGGCTDGAKPYGALVQGSDGNYYGTTFNGGANNAGTVFKISSAGALTTLYSFCAQSDCADGSGPMAALVQDTYGNFYGTTIGGGDYGPYGTAFKITPDGVLTTLYTFCSMGPNPCLDGDDPQAAVWPTSLTLTAQKTGVTSPAKNVTLKNNLFTALSISSFTFTGADPNDYAVSTTTCGSTLAAISSCSISVVFKPTAVGTRAATLNVNDSANNSPQTVSLSSTGK